MAYNLLHLAADGRDIAGLDILLARRGVSEIEIRYLPANTTFDSHASRLGFPHLAVHSGPI